MNLNDEFGERERRDDALQKSSEEKT